MIEDLDKLRKYREYLERTVEMSEDNAYVQSNALTISYRPRSTNTTTPPLPPPIAEHAPRNMYNITTKHMLPPPPPLPPDMRRCGIC